jgi:hypothetical protein
VAERQQVQFPCDCGATINADVPEPLFTNKPTVSMITFVHEEIIRCPKCRQGFVYAVSGIAITAGGFVAVNIPEEKKVFLAPPGSKIPPPRVQ